MKNRIGRFLVGTTATTSKSENTTYFAVAFRVEDFALKSFDGYSIDGTFSVVTSVTDVWPRAKRNAGNYRVTYPDAVVVQRDWIKLYDSVGNPTSFTDSIFDAVVNELNLAIAEHEWRDEFADHLIDIVMSWGE